MKVPGIGDTAPCIQKYASRSDGSEPSKFEGQCNHRPAIADPIDGSPWALIWDYDHKEGCGSGWHRCRHCIRSTRHRADKADDFRSRKRYDVSLLASRV